MISNERRDYYAGGLIVVIGIGTVVMGSRYKIGTLTQIGPGFMPTMLGVLLAIIGAVIAVLNSRTHAHGEKTAGDEPLGIAGRSEIPEWWGWGCIISGILLLVLLAQYAGLLPAIFFCVLVSARGDRMATWKSSLMLAAGVTAFGLFLFSWILGIQIPIVRGL